jgi:hypothetical protein
MGAGRHEAPPRNDPFMAAVMLALMGLLLVLIVLAAVDVPRAP